MKRFLFVSALFALASAAGPVTAADNSPTAEYCGKSSAVTPRELLSWDCSSMAAASMSELEAAVSAKHALQDPATSAGMKIYESQEPHFSAWVFFPDQKAVRYRALFDGEQWKGIGITVFCTGPQRDCVLFESSIAATAPPMPLMFKLGPPPPEMPTIVR